MALKPGGKDERLRRADFIALASLASLRTADANTTIDDVLKRLPAALNAVALPAALQLDEGAKAVAARTLDLCRARVAAFE